MNFESHLTFAKQLDDQDTISSYKEKFFFPKDCHVYLSAQTIGLMPKQANDLVKKEMENWAENGILGVERPILDSYELSNSLARLVGARPSEVTTMNGLSINLHLMLASFYRPCGKKRKILMEAGAFCTDFHVISSHLRYLGGDPDKDLLVVHPNEGEFTIEEDKILETISTYKDEISLVILENVNYLTGQCFNFSQIIDLCHEYDIFVGFDLAHGIGQLEMFLHDWQADFAVWCSNKYLNAGLGAVAGTFIHENHIKNFSGKRLEGWWGNRLEDRFQMHRDFSPSEGAHAWNLSCPPILQCAALRASLNLFDDAGISTLVKKGKKLASYIEHLFQENFCDPVVQITPSHPERRGNMVSFQLGEKAEMGLLENLKKEGIIVDLRPSGIIRVAPSAFYTSFSDIYYFVDKLKKYLT